MDYEKKKDSNPIDTIKKIKSILNSIGIDSLEELILDRVKEAKSTKSLRLYLKEDFFCGTNGKGTTLDYARASAYGEFMERIQCPYIITYTPPDNKKISKHEFIKSKVYEYFADKKYLTEQINIASNFKTHKIGKCIDTIPYYHVNSGKIIYLPHELKWYTSISTGTSAGNTEYESLVEAFSEIFERYIQTKAIAEHVSFPEISEKYYLQYDSLKNIINYIKNLGFKVSVKDASLNGKYPVACTIIKTPDEDGYFTCFGSHPYLPIAIERCLTETMQGFDISNENHIKFLFKFHNSKTNNITYSRYDNALWHKYIELNDKFFEKQPDYEFDESKWKYAEELSNKELINHIIKNLLEDKINIFIRNINFLDFPAFQIYIPELMSCYKNIDDDYGAKLKYNQYKCDRVFKNKTNMKITCSEILDFFKYTFRLKTKYSHNDYKNLELYYVIVLLINNEYKKALNILEKIKPLNQFKIKKHTIQILSDYIKLIEEGNSLKKTKIILTDKYGKFPVHNLIDVYFNKNGISNFITAMQKRKKFADNKNKNGIYRKKEIAKKLLSKYIKNLPSQYSIKNILGI